MKTLLTTTLIGLLLVAIIGLATERACFVMQLNSQTEQLEGYIYWRQLHYRDCICVRKTHIVADLQQLLINTGVARYDCGVHGADNIIGDDTKKAINNFMFDSLAKRYFAKD